MSDQTLHVLVADGDGHRLERVVRFLDEHYFYDVEPASNAELAWQLITRPADPFQVVLIDDALPEDAARESRSNGLDLLSKIKRYEPQTEVIIYTDRNQPDVDEALRVGAFRYLTKPFNMTELAVVVRHAAEYRQLKRAESEKKAFEVLLETSSALLGGNTSTQTEALDLIVKGIQSVGFDRVRLYHLSDDERYLVRKAYVGVNGCPPGAERLSADSVPVRTLLDATQPRLLKQPNGTSAAEDLIGDDCVAEYSCVSIQQHGKGVGIILADNSGRPITEEMLRPLSLFASQAAAAIENRNLIEADRKAKNLEAVLRVSTAITSSLDLEQTLQSACRAAVELIGVDHSGMVLFRPDMESGEVCAEYPNTGALHETIQVRGVEAEERLINSKEPLRVSDVEREESFGPVRELLLKMNVRSILVVPVIRHDNVVGSFSFDSVGRTRDFTEDEIELCKVFAAQAAVAIDNARLFDETNKQKDHFKRLLESSPNGMLELDLGGRITDSNERATQMLKYTKEEFTGKLVRKLYYNPEEHPRVCKKLLRSANHRITSYKSSARDKDGDEIPVHVSATWLHDAENTPTGSIVFFEDLRSIQEAQRETEVLLEASNIITRPESLEKGLESLAEMVVSLLRKTFCQILLRDESGLFLVIKAAAILPTQGRALKWKPGLGERIPQSVWPEGLDEFLRAGQPAVITSGDKSENVRRSLRNFSDRVQLENEVESMLLVPLKMGDLVVGLLCVGEVNKARREFSPEAMARASAVAAHTTALIELRRQFQVTERRKGLLAQLDASLLQISDEPDSVKLRQEIVRLAAQLFECEVAGLCLNRPQLKEMEITATYGLPAWLNGKIMPHDGGPLGEVGREGKSRIFHGYDHHQGRDSTLRSFELRTVAAVPLKKAGEVEAVLFVADRTDQRQLSLSDLEILERFAARASVALQTSLLLSKEQRVFDRMQILQKISDYMLREQPGATPEKILHVVLTGVTAGYGLGFNRAVLLLREEADGDLIGRMGIGQLDEREAHMSWDADHEQGFYDFAEFIRRLEQDDLTLTTVGELALKLRLPVSEQAGDLFSRAVLEREWQHITPEKYDLLPTAFRDTLEPTTEIAAVPLIARDNVLGLLVVDNKFTQAPITPGDIESLLAFANTVAIALDNIKLFNQTEQARLNLSNLYKTSNELISHANNRQVLKDIVQRTWLASGALSVRLILIDETGRAHTLHKVGQTGDIPLADAVRPNGIAAEVMRTGEPYKIPDKRKMADRVNPLWLLEPAEASLCLPLSLQEKRIGVMWINYEKARHFTDFEVSALNLFANQAALAYDSARRMEELEHMRRAANAMAAASTAREVLRQIVRSALEVLQADSAAIWSYDEVRHIFIEESSAVEGIPAANWKKFWRREPRENGTAHTVMREKYVVVANVADAGRYPFLGNSTRKLLGGVGVESFQGIALTVGGETLGVLYVNYKHRRTFSEEEQDAARTFANQAALALQKAKLLDQVNRARDAALVVANVTALENDLQKTLRAIADGTGDVLGSDAVMLYTYDAEHKAFGFPPTMKDVSSEAEVLKLGRVAERSVVHKVLALDSMHVAIDAASDPIMAGPFVHREGIKSSVGIPLIARGRKVGVMFVNFHRRHKFSDDELRTIELFAKQAAVAIRNGQLYQELQRRVAFLESMSMAGAAITGSLNLDEILRSIALQTWKLASSEGKQSFVEIKLIKGMKARLKAAYPPEEFARVTKEFGTEIDLEKGRDGRVGILGRAVRNEEDLNVGNVESNPDYIGIHEETRSQLVLLLKFEGQVIGAVSVEHSEYDAFDPAVVKALKSLAAQAAVSIHNARQFDEMKNIKGYIGRYTALRWLEMVNTSWGHNIKRGVTTARSLIRLVGQQISMGEGEVEVAESMKKLDRIIEDLGDVPINRPLSNEDEYMEHVQINDLAESYLTRQWQHDVYKSIKLVLDLQPDLDAHVTVRASRDWLRQALELVVDNAVRALNESASADKRLTFKTSLSEGAVRIEIGDTGPGFPAQVLKKLGRAPIYKEEGAHGAGLGLILAHSIVDTYGGKINMCNGEVGARVCIELPAELPL